jgi:hypothetical protein
MVLVEVTRALFSSMVLGENNGRLAVGFGWRRRTTERARTSRRWGRRTMMGVIIGRCTLMDRDMVRDVVVVGIGVLMVESTGAGVSFFRMELGGRDVRKTRLGFVRFVVVGVSVLVVLIKVTGVSISSTGMRLRRRGVARRARLRIVGATRAIDCLATRIRVTNGRSSVDGVATEHRRLSGEIAAVESLAERIN